MPVIGCPRCNKLLRFKKTEDLPHFPFCSKQCKMVDLDHWFEEDHRISSPLLGPDVELAGDPDANDDAAD